MRPPPSVNSEPGAGSNADRRTAAEVAAEIHAQLVDLRAQMKADFAELRALFIERVAPLEEHKRKAEGRHRYVLGILGAVAVGFALTAWKVFLGA